MSADLDRLAEDIASKTGASVAQVRNAVEQADVVTRIAMATALGLNYAPSGTKKGRPRDPLLAELRRLFPSASRRTIARHARALRLLSLAGVADEVRVALVRTYTRPSGSFNVAGYEAHAELLLWKRAGGA